MVESVVVSIPRNQVLPLRKVDRKPDFRNEKKYADRQKQESHEGEPLSNKDPNKKKGFKLDVTL